MKWICCNKELAGANAKPIFNIFLMLRVPVCGETYNILLETFFISSSVRFDHADLKRLAKLC